MVEPTEVCCAISNLFFICFYLCDVTVVFYLRCTLTESNLYRRLFVVLLFRVHSRDLKSGKVYYCGAERLSQLYPIMSTKKYKPAMKAELMEGETVIAPWLTCTDWWKYGDIFVLIVSGRVRQVLFCRHGSLSG